MELVLNVNNQFLFNIFKLRDGSKDTFEKRRSILDVLHDR